MPSKTTLVRILTPVATAVSAALTAWVSKHAPGVNIPTGDLVPLEVLGGVAALGVIFHWLQKNDKVVKLEADIEGVAEKVAAKVKSDPVAAQAASDLLNTLDAQKSEILKAIADAVHLPPSAEEVANQILQAAADKSVTQNVTPITAAPSAPTTPTPGVA